MNTSTRRRRATARSVLSLSLILSLASTVHSQESDVGFDFLPGKILFPPLAASYQEPRTGLRKEIGSSKMKLDIGTALDLLEYNLTDDRREKVRFGIDFFTYALTTSAQGHRLQVDAVDGFFGGHIAWRSDAARSALALRLRLLHLSAHFVDGHVSLGGSGGIDAREPIPFTRDFGELVAAYSWNQLEPTLMVYGGFSYTTLVRPVTIKRVAGLIGLEVRTSHLGPVFGRPFNVFAADNFNLAGIPAYVGTNNLECGVKFGDWDGSGVKVYISYYAGQEIFSQYYDIRRNQWGVGFSFDAW
jgi:hypothetical protein